MVALAFVLAFIAAVSAMGAFIIGLHLVVAFERIATALERMGGEDG
jgi:hypothetical protein